MTFEELVFDVKSLKVDNEYAVTVSEMENILDKKDQLLSVINDTLGTGFWTGQAYDLLWTMKTDLYDITRDIERKADSL